MAAEPVETRLQEALELAYRQLGRRDRTVAELRWYLRRRLPGPPDDDRARERALGLLVRRGYELELAYEAVRAFERC